MFVYNTGIHPHYDKESMGIGTPFMFLLGVDWGHLNLPKGQFASMAGVVPARILRDLLHSEELEALREEDDKKTAREHGDKGSVELDVLTAENDGEFTEEDFENALRKVSRKKPKDDKDKGKKKK